MIKRGQDCAKHCGSSRCSTRIRHGATGRAIARDCWFPICRSGHTMSTLGLGTFPFHANNGPGVTDLPSLQGLCANRNRGQLPKEAVGCIPAPGARATSLKVVQMTVDGWAVMNAKKVIIELLTVPKYSPLLPTRGWALHAVLGTVLRRPLLTCAFKISSGRRSKLEGLQPPKQDEKSVYSLPYNGQAGRTIQPTYMYMYIGSSPTGPHWPMACITTPTVLVSIPPISHERNHRP